MSNTRPSSQTLLHLRHCSALDEHPQATRPSWSQLVRPEAKRVLKTVQDKWPPWPQLVEMWHVLWHRLTTSPKPLCWKDCPAVWASMASICKTEIIHPPLPGREAKMPKCMERISVLPGVGQPSSVSPAPPSPGSLWIGKILELQTVSLGVQNELPSFSGCLTTSRGHQAP